MVSSPWSHDLMPSMYHYLFYAFDRARDTLLECWGRLVGAPVTFSMDFSQLGGSDSVWVAVLISHCIESMDATQMEWRRRHRAYWPWAMWNKAKISMGGDYSQVTEWCQIADIFNLLSTILSWYRQTCLHFYLISLFRCYIQHIGYSTDYFHCYLLKSRPVFLPPWNEGPRGAMARHPWSCGTKASVSPPINDISNSSLECFLLYIDAIYALFCGNIVILGYVKMRGVAKR